MVYSSSTASSSNPRNTSCLRRGEVDFFPRVLIPSNDNTGCVSIEKQERGVRWVKAEEPERGGQPPYAEMENDGTDQSSNVRLKYGFVEFET